MQPIEYIDGGVGNAIRAVAARHLAPVHLDNRSKMAISGRVDPPPGLQAEGAAPEPRITSEAAEPSETLHRRPI